MKKLKLLICAGAMFPLLLATSCKNVCTPSAEKNFVEISKTDNRYLALKDGSTYIPIGLNFCWPPNAWDSNDEQKTLDEIERQLDNLAKNGGNFVRIWISADFTEPEIAEGVYDENKAKRLDKIVDMCAKRGIKAKMCLHHFTRLSGGTPSHGVANKHYTRKFYDKKFGGSFVDNADFFTNPKGKALYLKRLDFFAKRYADNPTIFAWELWNEFDCVKMPKEIHMPWTVEMLGELRKRFPNNLATQSYGSFEGKPERMERFTKEFYVLPQDDLVQIHRYNLPNDNLPEIEGAQDICLASAIERVFATNPQKPVLLAETGVAKRNYASRSPEHDADKEGIILHDTIFAPFFAGAAGTGHIWYWDVYVQKHNLWHHFDRFSKAIEGFDPAAQHARPFRADTKELRIYGLKGQSQTMFWCRDKSSDIHTELRDNIPARELVGLKIKIDGKFSKARAYLDWEDEWAELKIDGGEIVLPKFKRSITVRLEK